MKSDILLIAFYNPKALGVRYLAEALKRAGYIPHILFLKEYNSKKPSEVSDSELTLLKKLIDDIDPKYIGLSVMSSIYIQQIIRTSNYIRDNTDCTIIWGGVYSTLFPEESLNYADYVIRGEGEGAIVDLIDALSEGVAPTNIRNLVYKVEDNRCVENPVRPLVQDLDFLGYPCIGQPNVYYITGNKLIEGDPQLRSLTYETTASRGCPFSCSYCSTVNLRRIYQGKGKYVRFRSVDSVIGELVEAKKKMRRLKLIHFWDEIFSDEKSWIEEFSLRYKREVGIPFTVWGHPLKVNEWTIKGLVNAGLYRMVVGIQSGSVHVRKHIFHRPESQKQIIDSSRIIARCGVPEVCYDFMLQHPFESLQDLVDTFELCLTLEQPFELNLHGLNFLPGTDIVEIAVSEGIFTREEMQKHVYGSMQDQYDKYWGYSGYKNESEEANVWCTLIFLTQFRSLHPLLRRIASQLEAGAIQRTAALSLLRKVYGNIVNVRRVWNKAKLLI